MHPALREVLDLHLEHHHPEVACRCHTRAADWFEAAGDTDLAIHHALGAGDLARAERLVKEHTVASGAPVPYSAVAGWITDFPDHYLKASPSLCLMAALGALSNRDGGGGAAVLSWLRFGERALQTSGDADDEIARRFDAFRALVDRAPLADRQEDAARALAGLPPGEWHATAALAHGAATFAAGDDERAAGMLREAAAEADISGAPTVAAVSRAHLALLLSTADDWKGATTLARTARASLRERGLDQLPAQILVTAMSALVEARSGDPDRARADWELTRENMAHLDGVLPWANVQSRLALARTSLLLSDRGGAEALRDELEALVLAQPDAIRPKTQLAELDEVLEAAHGRRSWDPAALTTAELRVLHYLPTNLTLAEIGERLYISRNTTKTHTTAIYRKLAATTRREAVEAAETLGLLTGTADAHGRRPVTR
jgi:LuxR family maltose regulon positive regulatory protein